MTMPPSGIPSIAPRDAATEASSGTALIVDVREPDEFVQQRVEGAALVPLSQFRERYEGLPKDRPLLMLCAAGSRSSSATMSLLQNGWTDVRNIVGGIIGWSAAGLPVRSGPPDPGEGDLPA